MDIITDKEDDVLIRWLCESCGGQSSRSFSAMQPVVELRNDWIRHINDSHRLTRDDVKDWYSY